MQIEYYATGELAPSLRAEILAVCESAYEEPMAPYLADIGPGVHAVGRIDGRLATHAMLVTRTLQMTGRRALRTAYVEMVATAPSLQGRGYASALLRDLVTQLGDYDLAALSPSDEGFYARLGWELWRGPLSVRTDRGLEASPDDEAVMILRLARTPPDLDLDAPLSVEWRPGEVW